MLKLPQKSILSCLDIVDEAAQVDDGVGGEYLLQQEHLKNVKRVKWEMLFLLEKGNFLGHIFLSIIKTNLPSFVLSFYFPGVVLLVAAMLHRKNSKLWLGFCAGACCLPAGVGSFSGDVSSFPLQ